MAPKIEVTVDGDKVTTRAPFLPSFAPRAKNLGGRFSNVAGEATWRFSAVDEQRVRALLIELYGTDGSPTETVDVHINTDKLALYRDDSLFLFGRKIAGRRGRDTRVDLGEDVILIAGGFPASGGSVRYPTLDPKDGTVLEVRGIPAAAPDLDDASVTIVTRHPAPAAARPVDDGHEVSVLFDAAFKRATVRVGGDELVATRVREEASFRLDTGEAYPTLFFYSADAAEAALSGHGAAGVVTDLAADGYVPVGWELPNGVTLADLADVAQYMVAVAARRDA